MGPDGIGVLGLENDERDRHAVTLVPVDVAAEVGEALSFLLGHVIAVDLVHLLERSQPVVRADRGSSTAAIASRIPL